MSYRPITYCRSCGEPFDVYRAPEDRLCDGCLETMPASAHRTHVPIPLLLLVFGAGMILSVLLGH